MQLHHAVAVIEVRIGDILGRWLLQKSAQRLPAVFGSKLPEAGPRGQGRGRARSGSERPWRTEPVGLSSSLRSTRS